MTGQNLDHSESNPGCLSLRQHARAEGVTHDGNLPFLLIPEGASVAVLLVHGFTSSPWEMRLLGEHLSRKGYAALAVRLPGHGTSPEDLARRRWQEWLSSVEQGYLLLAKQFRCIFGIGMSTGCLLTLALALRQELAGLVLFSPYLRLQHRLASHAGWLRFLRAYHEPLRTEPVSPHYYSRRPVAGVHQINLLINHLQPELTRIQAPALVFSGAGDQTVDLASGQELLARLGSAVKLYQQLGPDVPHVLTRESNPYHVEMFELTAHFIREVDDGQGPRSGNHTRP